MSYKAARDGLARHRAVQISSLLGETAGSWFLDAWDGIVAMLSAFSSDAENAAVASKYTTASGVERACDNIRLDYVCALRREVRKQYVSEDSDVCTDVTPFRHGVMSAHGASVFDTLMDTVVRHAEEQAKGG